MRQSPWVQGPPESTRMYCVPCLRNLTRLRGVPRRRNADDPVALLPFPGFGQLAGIRLAACRDC